MRTLLLLIILLHSVHCFGQDYTLYYRVFNRIDSDIIDKDFPKAIQRLDTIYTQYSFISAKHCIKGIQICSRAGDSIHAALWVGKAFRQGVPLWVLTKNVWTQQALNYTNAQPVINSYDSLRAIYKVSINKEVATRIDELLEEDQRRTRRVNDGFILFRHTIYGLQWLHNNKKQFREINRITDKYGFPGERLIGISSYHDDSAIAAKRFRFEKRMLTDERAYVMLIHYFSYPARDMNEKLCAAVGSGNLSPLQYGTLNDYRKQYGKEPQGKYQYYYVWKLYENNEPIDTVDNRRMQIALNSMRRQQMATDNDYADWNNRGRNITIME